ncbi:hypothetical protein ONE63_010341 [Megalurothrips usitatus]|uniref:ETS domain-containing protein n=1 Tax=Megalurothrips usitatus TaxID=439358 RepID=A0AAV7XHJ6_9NEOP|nr:hypothetical protein ONE63_010341 [Megalurothrips usitatus]
MHCGSSDGPLRKWNEIQVSKWLRKILISNGFKRRQVSDACKQLNGLNGLALPTLDECYLQTLLPATKRGRSPLSNHPGLASVIVREIGKVLAADRSHIPSPAPPEYADIPVEQWSADHVSQWLPHVLAEHISQDQVQYTCGKLQAVTGQALLTLDLQYLQSLLRPSGRKGEDPLPSQPDVPSIILNEVNKALSSAGRRLTRARTTPRRNPGGRPPSALSEAALAERRRLRRSVAANGDGPAYRKGKLWEFMVGLLRDPRYNPTVVRWVDEVEGVFCFTDTGEAARLWGQQGRNDKPMTYDKMSRALRNYVSGYFDKHPNKLYYKFGKNAKWNE